MSVWDEYRHSLQVWDILYGAGSQCRNYCSISNEDRQKIPHSMYYQNWNVMGEASKKLLTMKSVKK